MRSAPSANLLGSLGRLLATSLELLGVRLELLGTELEWAKRQLLTSLIWGGLGLILAGIGILLACAFVMILLWYQHRRVAAGALAVFFLALGTAFLRQSWKALSSTGSPFALSLEELARDGALLRPQERIHEPP